MKGWILILLLLTACSSTQTIVNEPVTSTPPPTQTPDDIPSDTQGDTMKLISNAFEHEGNIPSKFTCQGDDINPDLHWAGIPKGTKSFALIVDDPDAPMGTWVHWLVSNIPYDARHISENSVPPGAVQVKNDFRKENWGGPCPPSGTHRYFFKLYALDTSSLKANNKKSFYSKVKKHALAEAVLMGRYRKT